MNDYHLLEERLKELSSRRKVLEKKSQMRQNTLQEFERQRDFSTRSMYSNLENENIRAKARNNKFLEDVDSTLLTLAATRQGKQEFHAQSGRYSCSHIAARYVLLANYRDCSTSVIYCFK